MGAVRLRLSAELRTRWRAWAALALVIGLFGGAVAAAVAGARRTDSAFRRLLVATDTPDLMVFSQPGNNGFAAFDYEELARMPNVAAAGRGAGFAVLKPSAAVGLAAPADGRVGHALARRKVLAGRAPRPDRADELSVSFVFAHDRHVHVGSLVHLALAKPGEGDQQALVPFTFRVVGIDAAPIEFPPQAGTGTELTWATPAFYREHAADLVTYDAAFLRMKHGSRDVPPMMAALEQQAGGKPVQGFATVHQSDNTQRSIHLQAVALWLLAALLALAAVLVVVQLLARQAFLESAEYRDLWALGMGPGQLMAIGLARAAIVGALGGVIAVLVALALSPLTPVGLARTAEPRPGFAADWYALGLGAIASFLLVVVTAAWPSWREARHASRRGVEVEGRTRPSRAGEVLSRVSAPASVTTGVRLALEPGRGRSAVPVRSTVVGAVVGVTALASALVFGTSVNHLLATPKLYGVTWDAEVDSLASNDVRPVVDTVRDDPDVASLGVGYSGFPSEIDGLAVDGIALDTKKGHSLMPVPRKGRRPVAPDEAMLAARTMSALHAHIGSVVHVTVAGVGSPRPFRVVGEAVFPSLSDGIGLGKGVALTVKGMQAGIDEPPPFDTAMVTFRRGAPPSAFAALNRRVQQAGAWSMRPPDKPTDLVNFGRVQRLPLVLAALLGALAIATMAHLLVSSIRRRRRELAILKTVGFASGQVRATVAWQATTLAAVAVAVGVPCGLAAGRWIWTLFANQLGTVAPPTVSIATIATLVVGTVVIANLIALLPGRAAARVRPALVLRSE